MIVSQAQPCRAAEENALATLYMKALLRFASLEAVYFLMMMTTTTTKCDISEHGVSVDAMTDSVTQE
jgi:hypothetical protein